MLQTQQQIVGCIVENIGTLYSFVTFMKSAISIPKHPVTKCYDSFNSFRSSDAFSQLLRLAIDAFSELLRLAIDAFSQLLRLAIDAFSQLLHSSTDAF